MYLHKYDLRTVNMVESNGFSHMTASRTFNMLFIMRLPLQLLGQLNFAMFFALNLTAELQRDRMCKVCLV